MSQMIQCVLTFLTFSESKQAITLPFSTWQLFGGWANLHSSSLREQFPRWNCRHTSRVSHFVSLTEEMFNAMSKGYNHIWDFLKFNIIVVPHTPKAVGLLYVQSSFYNNQVSFFLWHVQLMVFINISQVREIECTLVVHSLVSILCPLIL